jgi:allophanate hydrolase subunit 1
VPQGSVALAGGYTGVYPRESPGGWQLIGRAEQTMFDPGRDPAAIFQPAVRVRFVQEDARR